MIAAFFATLLFAASAMCGHRSSRQIGGAEANFWRVCLSALFLGLWAYTFGSGLTGDAFPLFLISGVIGVGLGDTGFYEALPRLGSRRSVLLVQCFIRADRRADRMALARHDPQFRGNCLHRRDLDWRRDRARAGRPSAHHAARMAHRHRVQPPRRVLRRARHRREPQGLRGRARGGRSFRTPARRAISECWAACYFRPSFCWR